MVGTFSNVGDRLNARFSELGLKQLEVCQITGLSTTAMSQYCTGKRIPDTASLYKLASSLKVSMEWILTGEDLTKEDSTDLRTLKEQQGLLCDGSPLSEDEADLVAMYRLLPSHEREDLFDLVYFKYRKHVEKKAESIYWTYFDGDKKSGSPGGADAREGTA